MTNNKQQTAVKLYTEEQLLNTADAIRDYLKNYPEKFHESMIEKHLMNLAPITTKRTLIIYNTKETTEEEARHLLEILNCDDSTFWDNADHCGVQVIEVPLTYGGGEQ
jgi:methylmalonyl-CoA mutase N-terminal domain/subunit